MTAEPKKQRFRLEHTAGVSVSNADILADMKRVALEFGSGNLSSPLYKLHGKFSATTASKRFGSWNNALLAADLALQNEIDIPDEKLFENIGELWLRLGRQPRKREMVSSFSRYSVGPYRRFGSWWNAMEAFVNWAESNHQEIQPEQHAQSEKRRSTNREPNLALRFRVMRRDSFTCQYCGRSPARDLSVELHIDHVVPWAKRGETTIENLRTLCSKCNLGKGTQIEQANG